MIACRGWSQQVAQLGVQLGRSRMRACIGNLTFQLKFINKDEKKGGHDSLMSNPRFREVETAVLASDLIRSDPI